MCNGHSEPKGGTFIFDWLTPFYQNPAFLHVFASFSPKTAIKGPLESVYISAESMWHDEDGAVWNVVEMFEKIVADIRAALMLIAAEDLNALRVLLKHMTNSASKSVCVSKKA
jgi:hypothetical protein